MGNSISRKDKKKQKSKRNFSTDEGSGSRISHKSRSKKELPDFRSGSKGSMPRTGSVPTALPPPPGAPEDAAAYLQGANRPRGFNGPEIRMEDIVLGQKLGHGGFGTVYKALCYGNEVAVKVITDPSRKNISLFKEEVKLMSQISHPNTCLFLGACLDKEFLLVTELLNGDLTSLLKDQNKSYSLFQRMKWAKDVCSGMSWLHKFNIVHLDLKPGNILYDKNGTMKVADFGLAKIKPERGMFPGSITRGTARWKAPEIMLKTGFDERADVYSFGLLVWSIHTRNPRPYKEFKTEDLKQEVAINHKRPIIPSNTPKTLVALMKAAWHPDFKKRPGFVKILPKFDSILIESAIRDKFARKLWKKNFFEEYGKQEKTVRFLESVKWQDFSEVLCTVLSLPKEALNDGPGLSGSSRDLQSSLSLQRPISSISQSLVQSIPSSLPSSASAPHLPNGTTNYPPSSSSSVEASAVSDATDGQAKIEYTEEKVRCMKLEALEAVLKDPNEQAKTTPEGLDLIRREYEKRFGIRKLKLLKTLLAGHDEMVEIERFGKVVDLFGPIEAEGKVVVEKILEVLKQSWFHSDITPNQAFNLLRPMEPGTFLIRFSSSEVGYTASFVHVVNDRKKVLHKRIEHSDEGFAWPDESNKSTVWYPTITEFVQGSKKYLRAPVVSRDKYFWIDNLDSELADEHGYLFSLENESNAPVPSNESLALFEITKAHENVMINFPDFFSLVLSTSTTTTTTAGEEGSNLLQIHQDRLLQRMADFGLKKVDSSPAATAIWDLMSSTAKNMGELEKKPVKETCKAWLLSNPSFYLNATTTLQQLVHEEGRSWNDIVNTDKYLEFLSLFAFPHAYGTELYVLTSADHHFITHISCSEKIAAALGRDIFDRGEKGKFAGDDDDDQDDLDKADNAQSKADEQPKCFTGPIFLAYDLMAHQFFLLENLIGRKLKKTEEIEKEKEKEKENERKMSEEDKAGEEERSKAPLDYGNSQVHVVVTTAGGEAETPLAPSLPLINVATATELKEGKELDQANNIANNNENINDTDTAPEPNAVEAPQPFRESKTDLNLSISSSSSQSLLVSSNPAKESVDVK